jgi:hypothetical protein
MIATYTHIPLDRLDMTREEVEEFVTKLNAELDTGKYNRFHRAVITNDNELAIDARLARRLKL